MMTTSDNYKVLDTSIISSFTCPIVDGDLLPWAANVESTLSPFSVSFLLDTGSTISIIPSDVLSAFKEKYPSALIAKKRRDVQGFGGNQQDVYQSVKVMLDVFGKVHQVDLLIINNFPFPIMGRDIIDLHHICFDGNKKRWAIC